MNGLMTPAIMAVMTSIVAVMVCVPNADVAKAKSAMVNIVSVTAPGELPCDAVDVLTGVGRALTQSVDVGNDSDGPSDSYQCSPATGGEADLPPECPQFPPLPKDQVCILVSWMNCGHIRGLTNRFHTYSA